MRRAAPVWRRLKAIDPWIVDLALATALSAGAIFDWTYSRDPLWRLPLQLLIAGSVAGRRRVPLAAFGVAAAAAITLRVSPGAEGYAAILINAYSVGRYAAARWRSLVLLALVTAIGMTTTSIGSIGLVVLIAWLVGDLVRERAAGTAAAIEAANRGASEERGRIARELHDVIAHGVAVMVVQAEGARNLIGRDADGARQAIETISATGREALAELRQQLEALGPGQEDGGLRPIPGVDDIGDLVERVRVAGQPVALRVEGQPRRIPAEVGLAAFRVVQEGLTNAVKHAPGAATEVRIVFGSDLVLEVLDVGATDGVPVASGTQRGLAGLTERIRLLGGRLTAGRTQVGGYALKATIPIGPAGS